MFSSTASSLQAQPSCCLARFPVPWASCALSKGSTTKQCPPLTLLLLSTMVAPPLHAILHYDYELLEDRGSVPLPPSYWVPVSFCFPQCLNMAGCYVNHSFPVKILKDAHGCLTAIFSLVKPFLCLAACGPTEAFLPNPAPLSSTPLCLL